MGKQSKEEYAFFLSLWSSIHDKLSGSNFNEILAELRGIVLQSRLYGRAKELCKNVPDFLIQSTSGAEAIVKAIYKRDALSTVSDVYQDFMNFLNLECGRNETFRNFESSFEAQVSKFNEHSNLCKTPASLTALFLLANSNVDTGQHNSLLAAAALSTDVDASKTNDNFDAIGYSSTASGLRQCERSKHHEATSPSTSALHANSVSA